MTTFTLTFTGTVYAGIDNAGIFGAPNTLLTTDPFTAVYAIDNGNISGAALTITGQTYNFQTGYYSEVKIEPFQVAAIVQNGPDIQYGTDSVLGFNIYNVFNYPPPAPMFSTEFTPFSYTYDPLVGYHGQAYFKIDGYSGAYGELWPMTITLAESPPLAVPGPIIGTGLPALLVACASLIVLARKRQLRSSPPQ
jgi:hypothetical protein